MITNDQRMSWRTAWLQFLCEQNDIPYTGVERAEALESKLFAAGIPTSPSSAGALDIYTITGSDNNPTTDASVSQWYVIPDLTIEVPMKKGQVAMISATVCVRASTGDSRAARMLSLARSLNGGASWGNLGAWNNFTAPGNDITPLTLFWPYKVNNDQTVTFGVRMATATSGASVIAHANQRMMSVIVS